MATIRKRQLMNGGNAYTVQVKFKDKGSGKTILETTTWRPDGKNFYSLYGDEAGEDFLWRSW